MRILIALCTVLVMASCSYDETPIVVNTNNDFQVTLPFFMEETPELAPGEGLRYANRYRNLYVVADASPASGDLEAFRKEGVARFETYLDNAVIDLRDSVNQDGMKGLYTHIFGKMDDELVYYHHVVWAKEGQHYQMCIWTRGPEREQRFKQTIKDIIASFKPI